MSNIGRIFLLFYSSLQDTDRGRVFDKYYEGQFGCQTFPPSLVADCDLIIAGIFDYEEKQQALILDPEIEKAAVRYSE